MLKEMRETDGQSGGAKKERLAGSGVRSVPESSCHSGSPGPQALLTDASNIFFKPTAIHHDL